MLFLSFCYFDNHLCSWMLNIHFFENGRTIVCDDYISHRINKHLVHAFWPSVERTESATAFAAAMLFD